MKVLFLFPFIQCWWFCGGDSMIDLTQAHFKVQYQNKAQAQIKA